ncbi:MAG: exosortase system-associated protein, TIGR04073 family [Candidatus Omnitrophica bacterium]|nr:exosortase system-associated protein, TIGR04073 family [Candidatus Omnitrophota bacterium]
MKKSFLILGAFATVLFFAQASQAADNAFEKLGRGAVNIVTCPLEVPKQVLHECKENNPAFAFFPGIIKGAGFAFVRGVSGLWDVVSFPFQQPDNYEPLMKPEMVWEDGGYSIE